MQRHNASNHCPLLNKGDNQTAQQQKEREENADNHPTQTPVGMKPTVSKLCNSYFVTKQNCTGIPFRITCPAIMPDNSLPFRRLVKHFTTYRTARPNKTFSSFVRQQSWNNNALETRERHYATGVRQRRWQCRRYGRGGICTPPPPLNFFTGIRYVYFNRIIILKQYFHVCVTVSSA